MFISPRRGPLRPEPSLWLWGKVGAMGVPLEEGERMHRTDVGEDMVVESKRR